MVLVMTGGLDGVVLTKLWGRSLPDVGPGQRRPVFSNRPFHIAQRIISAAEYVS